jgi:hypothetical protein
MTTTQELIELITLKESKEDGLIFLKPSITIAALESLLKYEKRLICDFASDVLDDYVATRSEDIEKLYNETFNTKEK